MTDIWKDYRAAAGESKKSIRKKKLSKSLLSSGTHFFV